MNFIIKLFIPLSLIAAFTCPAHAETQQADCTSFQECVDAGKTAKRDRNIEIAIQYYEKAISLEPASAEAYYFRGEAYLNKTDLNRAIDDYSTALKLKPGYPEAFSAWIRALFFNGDPGKAIAECDKAIENDNSFTTAYTARAFVNRNSNKLEPALKDYDKALELDPANTNTYKDRATLNFQMMDYDAAIRDATKAVELSPGDGSAYWIRAEAYKALNNTEQFEADRKRAYETKDPHVLNIGKVYHSTVAKDGTTVEKEVIDCSKYIDDENVFNYCVEWRKTHHASEPADGAENNGINMFGCEEECCEPLNRAAKLMNNKDYDGAIEVLTETMTIPSEQDEVKIMALQLRAMAYYRKRDMTSFIGDYDTIISIVDNGYKCGLYLTRADFLAEAGEFELAYKDHSKAMEIERNCSLNSSPPLDLFEKK